MVKPASENLKISDRELETLKIIFFRYITSEYSQFIWRELPAERGEYTCLVNAEKTSKESMELRGGSVLSMLHIVLHTREITKKGIVKIELYAEKYINNKKEMWGRSQSFLLPKEVNPRALGDLAKLMFKWVKGELDKL